MDDDTRSKDLTLPEDEPWMSHGFISKIAAQVSLPYRRPKDGVKEIERRNGSLVVRYVSGADCLPYGKYPRLFELWACTMLTLPWLKPRDSCELGLLGFRRYVWTQRLPIFSGLSPIVGRFLFFRYASSRLSRNASSRMFNAAFTSLSCGIPHRSHTHPRSDSRNPLYLCPQSWQSLELG